MASVLAFCSDNPSLSSAKIYNFSVKFVVEKKENKQKEIGLAPFLEHGLIFLLAAIRAKTIYSIDR